MKKSRFSRPNTDTGMRNRTGVMITPNEAQQLVEGATTFSPKPDLDLSDAATMRAVYVEEGLPIGSMPTDDDAGMAALMDKLGARLAFERSGVRLYDAFIQKRIAIGGRIQPTTADLERLRDEELEHMHVLEEIILDLGGDPTQMTPFADVSATIFAGVLQVVSDPRTTVSQCLEAILAAELVDNDSWDVLTKMMQEQGLEGEAEDFEEAVSQEREHLQKVRSWILADALPRPA